MYPSVVASIFNNDSTYFNKFSPWYFLDNAKAQLSQDTLIDINLGVLSSYATRLKDKLKGYHIPYTFSGTGCQHDVGCLTQAQGDSAALFFYKSMKQLTTGIDRMKQTDIITRVDHLNNKLVINLNEQKMNISIYNISGQLVLSKQLKNTNELSIQGLRPGMYILMIEAENRYLEHISYSEKFIK